jgi:hypothetical protein
MSLEDINMKRYFSVVELVRIEYEHRTTDEQDDEIDKAGGYEAWLKSKSAVEIFRLGNVPEHNSIIDYLETEWDTVYTYE